MRSQCSPATHQTLKDLTRHFKCALMASARMEFPCSKLARSNLYHGQQNPSFGRLASVSPTEPYRWSVPTLRKWAMYSLARNAGKCVKCGNKAISCTVRQKRWSATCGLESTDQPSSRTIASKIEFNGSNRTQKRSLKKC